MQLEKPSPPRSRNRWSKVGPITENGKWTEGGRVADGPVVAMMEGNASGAKRPCSCYFSFNKVRQEAR
jgi:hypothetical protein